MIKLEGTAFSIRLQSQVERAYIIHIEAWDRNCPQHIMPRYTKQEIGDLDICPSVNQLISD